MNNAVSIGKFGADLKVTSQNSSFRRDTALLTKKFSLHIKHMLRRNFSLAPCLAASSLQWKSGFFEAL
ncbi:hypothetical protein ACFOKJ_04365 [Vogesella amnigena]|uniref:Uncharacterized protein n=1 Tax=Vogesella amnigena TaxID=1507449 RepID=A0ABV7TRL1_9NEIS